MASRKQDKKEKSHLNSDANDRKRAPFDNTHLKNINKKQCRYSESNKTR